MHLRDYFFSLISSRTTKIKLVDPMFDLFDLQIFESYS